MSEFQGSNCIAAVRQARGFTLVELMITIFVAFILLALALPSFRAVIMSNHVTESTNSLLTDLNLARSEAVHRGTLVALINNNGVSSSDWSGGWKVVVDSVFKNDGTFIDASDATLRVNSGVDTSSNYSVKSKVTALSSGTGITPTDGEVIFTAQGNMVPNATSFDFNICRPDSNPAKSKRITIVTSGMITTTTGTSGSPAPGC
jgi:type IV fimbrial biogenesis protein FimT